MNNLKKQLRSLKDHRSFGAVDELQYQSAKDKVMKTVRLESLALAAQPEVTQRQEKKVYVSWLITQYISRPAVAGAFSIAMIASGWLTTARAAESLPGDALYSVKILTERAKLSLASTDRKAVLHTEFAQHRLQEAARLQSAGNRAEPNPLVASTLEAYEMELAYAGEELMALSGEATLNTVTSIQANLNTVDTALDATLAQADDLTESSQMLAAKEATQEASRLANSVAVDMHDKSPSEQSTMALKESFKNKLGDLEARQQFDLRRIAVVEAALAAMEPEVIAADPTLASSDLPAYSYAISSSEDLIDQAMNQFAVGGYRTAFDALDEVDQALLDVESAMAQIEIAIMQINTAEPEPPEPAPVEVPEEQTEEEL